MKRRLRSQHWMRLQPRDHVCEKCGWVTKWHEHYPLIADDMPYQWGGEKWATDAWREENVTIYGRRDR